MEYLSDKFSLKSQAIKGSDYYMDQVMETLDNVQYYNKTSPKCVQAFSMQSNDQHTTMDRSSPCDNQNSKSDLKNFFFFVKCNKTFCIIFQDSSVFLQHIGSVKNVIWFSRY